MQAKPFLTIVLTGAVLAGCGGGGGESAESVAKGFVAAVVNKDAKRACGYLADSNRRELSVSGVATCPDVITGPGISEAVGTKVDTVNVSGDRATAGTDTGSFKLRKQDGKWRVIVH